MRWVLVLPFFIIVFGQKKGLCTRTHEEPNFALLPQPPYLNLFFFFFFLVKGEWEIGHMALLCEFELTPFNMWLLNEAIH